MLLRTRFLSVTLAALAATGLASTAQAQPRKDSVVLGMTANSTHTQPEARKEQVLRRWLTSLGLGVECGESKKLSSPGRGVAIAPLRLPAEGTGRGLTRQGVVTTPSGVYHVHRWDRPLRTP